MKYDLYFRLSHKFFSSHLHLRVLASRAILPYIHSKQYYSKLTEVLDVCASARSQNVCHGYLLLANAVSICLFDQKRVTEEQICEILLLLKTLVKRKFALSTRKLLYDVIKATLSASKVCAGVTAIR